MFKRCAALLPLVLAMLAVGCSDADSVLDVVADPPADWPENLDSAYSAVVTDTRSDFDIAPGGAPPYSGPVEFAPIDLVQVSLAMIGDDAYMRVEFDGPIPTAPVQIPASGEVEAQVVHGQSFSINLDSDNDDGTGAGGEGINGIDLFFAINAVYGRELMAYVNYGFPTGDVHEHLGHIEGVAGEGGPGSDYVILRYDMASIDSRYFPRGTTVEIGGWSEAESDLYHHYAFDPLVPSSWDIPQ